MNKQKQHSVLNAAFEHMSIDTLLSGRGFIEVRVGIHLKGETEDIVIQYNTPSIYHSYHIIKYFCHHAPLNTVFSV